MPHEVPICTETSMRACSVYSSPTNPAPSAPPWSIYKDPHSADSEKENHSFPVLRETPLYLAVHGEVSHTINANLDLLMECYNAKMAEDRRESEQRIEDLTRKLERAEHRNDGFEAKLAAYQAKIAMLEEHLKLEKEANLLD